MNAPYKRCNDMILSLILLYAGLRRIVRLLQDHWLELSGISRADFWALCGQEAVQEARSLDNGEYATRY